MWMNVQKTLLAVLRHALTLMVHLNVPVIKGIPFQMIILDVMVMINFIVEPEIEFGLTNK